MSETTTTSATYDQIAASYAARPALAETMDLVRRRFAAQLGPSALVLDVGCGPAHDTAALRELGLRAAGMDRSRGMLAQARQRGDLPLLLGDMRRLPLGSGSLDGLWVCASFLHIPKRSAPDVLCELRRVLRIGGRLYLSVKQGQGERWVEHHNNRRFFAFYQPAELDAMLVGAGFTIRESWVEPDAQGRPENWIGCFAEAAQR